jgi:hypothetical protein
MEEPVEVLILCQVLAEVAVVLALLAVMVKQLRGTQERAGMEPPHQSLVYQ